MNKEIIQVLIADDHTILRKGMVLLLSEQADIAVVGEAGDGVEAIDRTGVLKPDVVVMETDMPRLSGIEATRQIKARFPDTRVIAFSSQSSRNSVDDMLRAGAACYLLKDSSPEELLQGIRAVYRGEMCLSNALTGTVLEAYVDQISDEQPENRPREESAILRTKLHPPPYMPDLVPRIRLIDHLDAGQLQPLILVSAPAGYGKSILVSSWLTTCGWPSGWGSLDKSDSDMRQFLLSFVAAVKDIFPSACEQTRIMANALQLPPVSTLTATLSNELGQIGQPFILVLDDYYRVDAKSPVNDLIYHLLERPPLPLHLVIITRRDPPLQMVTLRSRDQVTELRMQDLCFTREETKALLENAAAFTASDGILDDLSREIEGWAVGLRLVSQVLRSTENQDAFLENLHSGVQQTNAYLLQEVFVRQTPELQEYLLRLSILDRFCASLGEAVCHLDTAYLEQKFTAEKIICELTEANLFTISLDSRNKWFRFHHLFQQLLQYELENRMSSDEISGLHKCAGQWFKDQGLIDEAVQHFLAGGDTVGAAGIIGECHWRAEQEKYGWRIIERWLSLLPARIKEQHPDLLLSQAWVLHFRHEVKDITPIVQQLELMAMATPLEEFQIGELKIFQGMLHYWAGKGEAALQLFLDAKKMIPEKYRTITGLIAIWISLTSQMSGQGKASLRELNTAIDLHDQLNKVFFVRLVIARTYLQVFSGELTVALQDAQRISSLLAEGEFNLMQGWGNYLEASCCFRLNNLQAALEHFSISAKFRYSIHTGFAIDSMIGLALSHQAMGQSDAAIESMEKLLHFARETGQLQHLTKAQSGQARLALAQGDLDLAKAWLHSFDEKPSAPSMWFWLENSSITRARVLLTIESPESLEQANTMLASLRQETEALHNTCQLIEIMILQVIALEKLGYGVEAISALEQVIALAEPGGWIRPFVEPGPLMAEIIQRLADPKGATGYLHLVLDTCRAVAPQTLDISTGQSRLIPDSGAWSGEALTNRELDILDLLTRRLQNKEMAAHLFVSPETIKTHLKHLYQKLGVNNRREAAALAREILPPVN